MHPRPGHRYNEYVAARREQQRRTVPRSVSHQPLVPAQRAACMEKQSRPSAVHGLRNIGANREITISYISGVSPGYAERQRHPIDIFSFARNSSDYRLDQIRSINEDEGTATNLN
jgi:hypothetical protein